MQEYASKEMLIEEIKKNAAKFIQEFQAVEDADIDLRLEDVDRTPREMLAYQLGWMGLIRGWDSDELEGKEVITPAPGYKWNQMGELYEGFYKKYSSQTLSELTQMFDEAVSSLILWIQDFSDEEIFQPGGRKWAQSTPSDWPIWKWIHINTAAPFKSFRTKIRKWKKLREAQ